MDTYVQLAYVIAVFVIFHFVIRKSNYFIRIASIITIWSILLPIPILLDYPRATMETLMGAVLCFIIPLKLTEIMILLPNKERKEQTIVQFAVEFLYFMFMLKKVKSTEQKNPISVLIQNFIIYTLVALIKMVILVLVYDYLSQCIGIGEFGNETQNKMDENYNILVYYNIFFLITVPCGVWTFDFFEGIIPLITLDHFRYSPFNNWLLFSTSITELWGKRYNLLIHGLLKTSVFLPMKRLLHCSNSAAALSSFVMSGILHVYVVYITFGPGYELYTLLFFLIHGIICCFEAKIKKASGMWIPIPFSIFYTLLIVSITTPIYTRPLMFPTMLNSPWESLPSFIVPYLPHLSDFISPREYCL